MLPVQSTGGTGNSGVVTDPDTGFGYLDPAIWGDVNTGHIGGGEHTDMNVTLQ